MTDAEIDAAIKVAWPYYRPLRGIIYEREIFRAGMRAAAKICDDYATGSPPGNRTHLCGIGAKDCASAIRKAAE